VETTTGDGGRDAEINRVLSILQRELGAIRAPDERTARIAGRLRHRASTDDGIDALVAAAAVAMGTKVVLLTSDRADLERLLSGESDVAIRSV